MAVLYYAAPLGLPIAWLVVTSGSGVLALLLFLHLIDRRLRCGRPARSLDNSLQRLSGRICGPGPCGRPALLMEPSGGLWKLPPLEVGNKGGQRWRVSARGETVLCWPRRGRHRGRLLRWLAVGDAVTLEGYLDLSASREAGYRTQAAETRLEAVRIARGTWPEARGLGLATLLCLALSIGGGLVLVQGDRYQIRSVKAGWRPADTDVPDPEPEEALLQVSRLVPACNCVAPVAILERPPACCGAEELERWHLAEVARWRRERDEQAAQGGGTE